MSYATIVKLKNRFNFLYKSGDLKQAAYLGELILSIYKKCGYISGKRYGDDMFDIAIVFEEIGNFSQAIELYAESAVIIKKCEGQSLNFTYRLNNLAIATIKSGDPQRVIKYLEKCLKLREELLGEKNELTVQSLYNLGNACYDAKRFEEAAYYLERSLSNRSNFDKDYIDNLNSLGYAYVALDDFDNALEHLYDGLKMTEETEGIHSIEYVQSLYYLANVYKKRGNDYIAQIYMELFVSITWEISKGRYPRLLKAFEGVANPLKGWAAQSKTIDFLSEAVEISYEGRRKKSNSYIESLSESAREDFRKGSAKKCIEGLKKALHLRREFEGEDNMAYIKDLVLLSSCYYDIGNVDKTINIFYEIMEIIESNRALFEECFQEMVKTFAEYGGIITEDERNLIFEQLEEFFGDSESFEGFNRHFFDDFEQ